MARVFNRGYLFMSNISPLHGIALSPFALLASMQDDLAKSKAMLVVYTDDDGVVRTRWSSMNRKDLAFMLKILDIDVTEEIKGNEND